MTEAQASWERFMLGIVTAIFVLCIGMFAYDAYLMLPQMPEEEALALVQGNSQAQWPGGD
jgi:hypothetical protein